MCSAKLLREWNVISFRKSSNAVEKLRSAIGDEHFDAVIDFSAYDSDVVKDALKVLDDRIKLYIYISTDSVYEVGNYPWIQNREYSID